MSTDTTLNLIKYYFFDEMENKVANAIFPPFDLDFVRIIRDLQDRREICNYLKIIYRLHTNYMSALLFNHFNMDGPDSGDFNMEHYKIQYDIAKEYYCTSKKSRLYNLIKRNYINNIQNIDQNNL